MSDNNPPTKNQPDSDIAKKWREIIPISENQPGAAKLSEHCDTCGKEFKDHLPYQTWVIAACPITPAGHSADHVPRFSPDPLCRKCSQPRTLRTQTSGYRCPESVGPYEDNNFTPMPDVQKQEQAIRDFLIDRMKHDHQVQIIMRDQQIEVLTSERDELLEDVNRLDGTVAALTFRIKEMHNNRALEAMEAAEELNKCRHCGKTQVNHFIMKYCTAGRDSKEFETGY